MSCSSCKFFRNIRKRRRGFPSSVHRIKTLQGSLLALPDVNFVVSTTNTTFASIPLLMPCRALLSCIAHCAHHRIRGTELAGHPLCCQRQLPYLLWRASLPWPRHHVKPEWHPSMIQQRFGFWLPVFLLFAWQKNAIYNLFRALPMLDCSEVCYLTQTEFSRGDHAGWVHAFISSCSRSGTSSLENCTTS